MSNKYLPIVEFEGIIKLTSCVYKYYPPLVLLQHSPYGTHPQWNAIKYAQLVAAWLTSINLCLPKHHHICSQAQGS